MQCIGDIGEELERQLRIEQGIVDLHSRKPRFLILLDEAVVGIFGKRQWAQVQRVDGGQVEQLQIRRVPGEECEVVLDDVVADQMRGSAGEFIECRKGRAQPAATPAPGKGGRAVGSYRSDRADVVFTLEVDRQQPGKALRRQTAPYPFVIAPTVDCHR